MNLVEINGIYHLDRKIEVRVGLGDFRFKSDSMFLCSVLRGIRNVSMFVGVLDWKKGK